VIPAEGSAHHAIWSGAVLTLRREDGKRRRVKSDSIAADPRDRVSTGRCATDCDNSNN
jgi:hypothetical protein